MRQKLRKRTGLCVCSPLVLPWICWIETQTVNWPNSSDMPSMCTRLTFLHIIRIETRTSIVFVCNWHDVIKNFLCVVYWSSGHLFSFSIQQQHCEIKNEDSKRITIKTIGEAKVLVNGEPVDDDEEEELHHLDRFYFLQMLYRVDCFTGFLRVMENLQSHLPFPHPSQYSLFAPQNCA